MVSDPSTNALLAGLPPPEFSLLQPHLVEVVVKTGEVLSEAGQAAEFVYFPIDAVLSLVGATGAGSTVEVAVVGREGVASVSALLGRNRLPFRVVTHVSGRTLRLPTEAVSKQLRDCATFHDRLLAYSEAVIFQVGQSAICNRFHNAKQRLARWLLMTIDRTGPRPLPLTHEFISYMVGGPRSAVTEAAAALRSSGAIAYRRGLLTVEDYERLRHEACECYDVVRDLSTTLVPGLKEASSRG